MTTPSGPALDRNGDMLAQHEAGTLTPIEDEPDIRPQPTGLDAARDLLADISTAALAMIDIIEKGEGRHEEGDDGETVSAYVDQAARPVVEELRDALRRWGE